MHKIMNTNEKAEGWAILPDGRRFAYDTQLVNADGCAMHFWLGDTPATPELLDTLKRVGHHNRDVVGWSYSPGEPSAFWAQSDISMQT